MLKIDVTTIDYALKEAPLDCDEPPPIGHPVGAFGFPWNLEFTGTRGIISSVTADRDGFIRMDASINPGNSGGPLISLETGRVVGISTASVDDASDQNTNFAVPILFVCRILEILHSGGDPSPPRLPVIFLEPPRDREALIVARSYLPYGLLDLKPGDEIMEDQGRANRIVNEAQLIHALRGRLDDVNLKVKRDGREIAISGQLPAAPLITERAGVLISGLLIGPPTFSDSAILGIDNGLTVHSVEPGSAGEDLEFQPWDILTTINGKRYRNVKILFTDLKKLQELGQPVVIEILRISGSLKVLFEYLKRELPIEDLELVSGQ